MKLIGAILVFTFALVGLSCKPDPTPIPAITGFSPSFGAYEQEITISGHNFSSEVSQNQVKFNGIAGMVVSSTAEKIVAKVPIGALSGVIVVTTNGQSGISKDILYVNKVIGQWEIDNAIYSFCDDPLKSGLYKCPSDCFQMNFGWKTVSYIYMFNSSPEYPYTITDTSITIQDSAEGFTATYSAYGSTLVFIYKFDGCNVQETYHGI